MENLHDHAAGASPALNPHACDNWGNLGNLAARFTKARHARATRILGLCLDHQHDRAWQDVATIWFLLDGAELVNIVLAGLRALTVEDLGHDAAVYLRQSLPDDQRRELADRMADLGEILTVGAPIAPLFNAMEQARFWADLATRNELKAYALACFNRLPPTDQAAFLRHVQRGGV